MSSSVSVYITGSSSIAIKIPYITRAILLPISIVTIYCPGYRESREIIFELKEPSFLYNSILSLLDDTYAISIPEKNAENRTDMIMVTMMDIIRLLDYLSLLFRLIFFLKKCIANEIKAIMKNSIPEEKPELLVLWIPAITQRMATVSHTNSRILNFFLFIF